MLAETSQGSATALEALLARFLPELQRYVERQVGPALKSRESSADLVQSTCRELLECLATERFEFRGEAEFRQWLYRAALLKIQERARFHAAAKRDLRREERGGDAASSRAEALLRTLSTPSGEALGREERARLEEAFALLPDKYRTVLSLAYLEGLSHQEIGARLGVTPAHSSVLLSRALAHLARQLGDP